MRQISCPKCSETLAVPAALADDRGRVRLVCEHCGARVLVKVNPRALRLDPAMNPTPPRHRSSPGIPLPVAPGDQWAIVVYEHPTGREDALRRALLTLPRFRANPNKLHDLTAELPWVIHGLKGNECQHLQSRLTAVRATLESGPQSWLLDEQLIPLPEDLRGPRPSLEPEDTEVEVLGSAPTSSLEIDFGGGRPSQTGLSPISMPREPEPEVEPEPIPQEALAPLEAKAFWESTSGAEQPFESFFSSNDSGVFDEERPGLELEIEGGTLDHAPAIQDDDLPEHLRSSPSIPGFGPPGSYSGDFTAVGNPPPEGIANPDGASPPSESLEPLLDPHAQFAIVTVNELPGRTFHIGTLHTSVAVSAADLDIGSQMAIEVALDQAHAVLQERAADLGATGIVGLKVSQTALPSKAGWMLVIVVSGTAVA